MTQVPDAHAKTNPSTQDPRAKPAWYGPGARTCGAPIADEDGRPTTCKRPTVPGDTCTHGIRQPASPDRLATVAALRQALANTRGVHERAEVGAEERRKGAGNG